MIWSGAMRATVKLCYDMVTFKAELSSCGVVEIDDRNVLIGFHEKVGSPSDIANAAIYLVTPEFLILRLGA